MRGSTNSKRRGLDKKRNVSGDEDREQLKEMENIDFWGPTSPNMSLRHGIIKFSPEEALTRL